jgi:hypothetical protein
MPAATVLRHVSRIAVVVALSVTTLSASDVAADSNRPQASPAAQSKVSGTLTCAALASGSYKCNKNQPRWSCTLQCVRQGSAYVLQDGGKVYSVSGQTSQVEHFAADSVVVTGEVSDAGINIRSIVKR